MYTFYILTKLKGLTMTLCDILLLKFYVHISI